MNRKKVWYAISVFCAVVLLWTGMKTYPALPWATPAKAQEKGSSRGKIVRATLTGTKEIENYATYQGMTIVYVDAKEEYTLKIQKSVPGKADEFFEYTDKSLGTSSLVLRPEEKDTLYHFVLSLAGETVSYMFTLSGRVGGDRPATEAPAPTKAPEPTKAPAPTEAPELTKAPEPTEAPAPTKAPAPTEAPELTKAPAPTEALVPTEAPAPTKASTSTGMPVPTADPTESTISTEGPAMTKPATEKPDTEATEGPGSPATEKPAADKPATEIPGKTEEPAVEIEIQGQGGEEGRYSSDVTVRVSAGADVKITGDAAAVRKVRDGFDISQLYSDETYKVVAEKNGVRRETTIFLWGRDITEPGEKILYTGKTYRLGAGRFRLQGEDTVYEGNQAFSVAEDGKYTFLLEE